MYKIKVDAERIIGQVSPLIYGHLIEHLGRCIEGGILDISGKRSDKHGFRTDVLTALRRIRPTILRWPGGCFADIYHWRDGIGPKEGRPVRLSDDELLRLGLGQGDVAWDIEESNQFGTDEFIQYCREIGAEPYICTNVGSGTPEEAAAWVEYCNGAGNTSYAHQRRANGHEQPHKVKYWGLGNEIDETGHETTEIGCMSGHDYARTVREFSKLMRRVSPEIKLIAVGSNQSETAWDLEVLEKAGKFFDYIAIHGYYGTDDYYSTVAGPVYAEKRFRLLASAIEIATFACKLQKRIQIAFDEWNIWYRAGFKEGLEESYSLKDALFAVGIFNVLHRICNVVTMANLSLMVNALGMIKTTEEGMALSPIYHAFDLYVNHTGDTALDTFVVSDTFDTQDRGGRRGLGPWQAIPYLDASATLRRADRTLCLGVLNRHLDQAIECQIELRGFSPRPEARVFELNGPDVMAENKMGKPEAVKVLEVAPPKTSERFTYVFPAHSATVIEIEI